MKELRPIEPKDSADMSLGPLPEMLGYQLRRVQVASYKHFSQEVGDAEKISPGLGGMLLVIVANPGLSQSRLAEIMDVARSAIVKVVDKLERRGLVRRNTSSHDRRIWRLHPTTEGLVAARRIEARARRHEKDFAQALSPEERKTLIGLLAKL